MSKAFPFRRLLQILRSILGRQASRVTQSIFTIWKGSNIYLIDDVCSKYTAEELRKKSYLVWTILVGIYVSCNWNSFAGHFNVTVKIGINYHTIYNCHMNPTKSWIVMKIYTDWNICMLQFPCLSQDSWLYWALFPPIWLRKILWWI